MGQEDMSDALRALRGETSLSLCCLTCEPLNLKVLRHRMQHTFPCVILVPSDSSSRGGYSYLLLEDAVNEIPTGLFSQSVLEPLT